MGSLSDWRGLSDAARADLVSVISDFIGRGVNPRVSLANALMCLWTEPKT